MRASSGLRLGGTSERVFTHFIRGHTLSYPLSNLCINIKRNSMTQESLRLFSQPNSLYLEGALNNGSREFSPLFQLSSPHGSMSNINILSDQVPMHGSPLASLAVDGSHTKNTEQIERLERLLFLNLEDFHKKNNTPPSLTPSKQPLFLPPAYTLSQRQPSPLGSKRPRYTQESLDLPPIVNIPSREEEGEFAEISNEYDIIEKIGEGTFSMVYKAVRKQKTEATSSPLQPPSSSSDEDFVALKRINPTCSPARICNEMKHLKNLGGKHNVLGILRVLRHKDQLTVKVTLVTPYVANQKFKDIIRDITMEQMRNYMSALLEALAHLHSYNLIHRDVKPGNFLCDLDGNQFRLIDFGLAEFSTCNSKSDAAHFDFAMASAALLKRRRDAVELGSIRRYSSTESGLNRRQPQPTMHAPRAGTRGFRAPEVLLKFRDQTTAVDVWSAGIVMLSMCTGRYPFFNSPDDLSSLAEVSAAALQMGRRVHFPIEVPKIDLKTLCKSLNPTNHGEIAEEAYDLLYKLLALDPRVRISAREALNHPFLKK
ncbi:hypothetical protein PROFUN_07467 [Planoprotostelium fungivorum]|uniref:non-specific serine/threonine protein kinase n=1 Tax=Planoprotostelium fungivorum TaxID=1890364 RepID=A0A2P6NLH1_9EUKA|nr:hypothetical protein PROFUN_07467 [Planoprotostelium fungivorum]